VGESAASSVRGPTGSGDDFAHVTTPLFDLRRVILVDLPGHGDSPRSDRYSLQAMTAAVTGFLEDVIGTPCDLLGHSMGGRVVLPIAIEGPELLQSLVLMDTWADPPDPGADSNEIAALLALPDAEAAVAWEQGPPEPATAESDLIVDRWGQDWLDAHSAHNNQVDPLAVIQLAREFADDPGQLLAASESIACPTTVLVGELDGPFVGPSGEWPPPSPAPNW
jgi:pimeloyl-ACP methyl ester carboxylesterase